MRKTLIKENGWRITTSRYVAYLDIMGFKEMVLRSTHEEIYEMMLKIEKSKSLNENVQWQGQSDLVKSTTYSDSIMIYSKDNKKESAESFVCTVSGVINDLLTENIPYKGAIAFGTMTLDTKNSIFFGQPLIDAYLLQEELYFYGTVLHASAEKELINFQIPFIKNHFCPFKNGSSWIYTIEPFFARFPVDDDLTFKEDHLKLFESVKKFRFNTSGHLRRYIDNTENYLQECIPKESVGKIKK